MDNDVQDFTDEQRPPFECFVADVHVDPSYFNKDGTLNETRLMQPPGSTVASVMTLVG
jgi:hypothetical protein